MSSPYFDPPAREVITEGETLHFARYLTDAQGSALGSAGVTSWSFKIYDRLSTSEDVAAYSSGTLPTSQANADGSPVFHASAVVNGYSPDARGHHMHHQLSLGSFIGGVTGGSWYSVEYSLTLGSAHGGNRRFGVEIGVRSRFS